MKRTSSLMFVLTVLLLTVASASAVANEKVVTGTQTMVMFAGNSSDGLSDLIIYAYQLDIMGEKQTIINFKYYIYDESDALIEEYSADYIPIDNSSLTVKPGLTSARLSIPELRVNDSNDNQFNVSVNLTWSSDKVIKVDHSEYKPVTRYDDVIQIMLISGREGTLTGSIEGEDINIDAATFTPYDVDMGYKMSLIAQYSMRAITVK